jgi:uncharacterized protein with beta-barrel porin domain
MHDAPENEEAGARHISQSTATVQVNTTYSEGCSSAVHPKHQHYYSGTKAMAGGADHLSAQGTRCVHRPKATLLQSSAHMPSLLPTWQLDLQLTGNAEL